MQSKEQKKAMRLIRKFITENKPKVLSKYKKYPRLLGHSYYLKTRSKMIGEGYYILLYILDLKKRKYYEILDTNAIRSVIDNDYDVESAIKEWIKEVEENGEVSSKRTSFPKDTKTEIFKKYKNECAICRRKKFLHIHHKDRDAKNNKIPNLTLLCSICHKKIHRKPGNELSKGEKNKVYSKFNDECVACGSNKNLQIYFKDHNPFDMREKNLTVLCFNCFIRANEDWKEKRNNGYNFFSFDMKSKK
jgi:hypothetical protein